MELGSQEQLTVESKFCIKESAVNKKTKRSLGIGREWKRRTEIRPTQV